VQDPSLGRTGRILRHASGRLPRRGTQEERKNRLAAYANIKAKADATHFHVYPIMGGRARALLARTSRQVAAPCG
jgi:hypothetical protein